MARHVPISLYNSNGEIFAAAYSLKLTCHNCFQFDVPACSIDLFLQPFKDQNVFFFIRQSMSVPHM